MEIEKLELKWYYKLLLNIIKCGPIPKHVAFIMDGNRRFASKEKIEIIEGHNKGYDKWKKIIDWCLILGIKEVTCFAFSLENLKRSQDEVQQLFNLFRKIFKDIQDQCDTYIKRGIGFRFIGDFSNVSEEDLAVITGIEEATKNNAQLIVTVAGNYTSRTEIVNSIKMIADGIKSKSLEIEDVTPHLITNCLYRGDIQQPDLLIRTSGENRFSDFLLWQIGNTNIYFTDVLWPDLTVWDLIECVITFQRNYFDLKKTEETLKHSNITRNNRIEKFLENLRKF